MKRKRIEKIKAKIVEMIESAIEARLKDGPDVEIARPNEDALGLAGNRVHTFSNNSYGQVFISGLSRTSPIINPNTCTDTETEPSVKDPTGGEPSMPSLVEEAPPVIICDHHLDLMKIDHILKEASIFKAKGVAGVNVLSMKYAGLYEEYMTISDYIRKHFARESGNDNAVGDAFKILQALLEILRLGRDNARSVESKMTEVCQSLTKELSTKAEELNKLKQELKEVSLDRNRIAGELENLGEYKDNLLRNQDSLSAQIKTLEDDLNQNDLELETVTAERNQLRKEIDLKQVELREWMKLSPNTTSCLVDVCSMPRLPNHSGYCWKHAPGLVQKLNEGDK